jgi:fumarate reductase subunit D
MSRRSSSRRAAWSWLLFGAGGTLSALTFPALVSAGLVLALAEPTVAHAGLHRIAVLLEIRWVRWGLVLLCSLALWHAAHRVGLILHDLRLPRTRRVIGPILHVLAAAAAPVGLVLLR